MKQRTISDILEDECDGRYCILKVLIEKSGMSDYMLEQVKCIEKFKYEESEREGRDIGWEEATRKWVDRGYAERFIFDVIIFLIVVDLLSDIFAPKLKRGKREDRYGNKAG